MRILAAFLALLLTASAAIAQNEAAPSGAAAKPAEKQFRKPVVRSAILRAHAAARRARIAAESAAGEGTIRTAAAAVRKRAAPPSTPSTTPAPSRDGASALADRIAIQTDLAWVGEYHGLINGELNDKTTTAIKSFQRSRKFKETGTLSTQERALLAASAKAKQAQVGWSLVDDPATGARIGLPTKQVPNRKEGKNGTRWSSAQGQVQVETFRVRDPGTTLAAIYEQQKKEPAARRLDLNVYRPDHFVLSGMQTLKRFYVRADVKDGEVRGMSVLYDQATEPIMDPVAVVMSNAFTPFPGIADVAQTGGPARPKVEYGSGIVVSAAGHILTDRQLTDGCNVIVVSGYGDADRQAHDAAADLALLRVYGAPDLVPAAFAVDGAASTDVTLVGIADPQSQGGGSAISTQPAKLKGEAAEPAPQGGFSGAAALDAAGRVVGMVELKAPILVNVGAAGAQPQATIVPAPAIRAFLEHQQLASDTGGTTGSGTTGSDGAKASVVRVICVRK
jgi:hypothetical protein